MPNLQLFFARRYLFSKKSHSVINIISGVSAFSIAIPVMAMVILLSVFNGLEGLVKDIYRNFDPDMMVTPVKGKVFDTISVPYEKLKALEEVAEISYALEDDAMLEYGPGGPGLSHQLAGTVRGVDSLYDKVVPIRSLITNGEYRLRFGDMNEAVVGEGVALALGIRTSFYYPLKIYAPRHGNFSPLLPNYNQTEVFPGGVFTLEAEIDGKYVLIPLEAAQELFGRDGKASSILIRTTDGVSPGQAQAAIEAAVGPEFKVQSRYQQNEEFYRIMMYERWGVFFIILLVLVVASFSLIGSLVMLIIDKQKDMRTLITMGADTAFLRKVFIYEGMLIYGAGAVMGLVLGLTVSFAQQYFGIIAMPAQTFLVDSYPVEVHLSDIILIVVTFTLLSYIISGLTVRAMIPKDKIRIS